jgi:hypothetical protein
VVLSVRDSTEAWWKSFSQTILEVMQRGASGADQDPWFAMTTDMLRRFSPNGLDEASLKAAYEAHNQSVRDRMPAGQLVEWRPGDGWGPLCEGLGVPVPAEEFPHVNTTDEFRMMVGLNAEG